ncbi:MAG: hypothetical protein QME74_04275 [Candidatus Edwardsbacteria bacterium]|nr:hypothetical protein [Candidatus Edwardsbacteria bacterium]
MGQTTAKNIPVLKDFIANKASNVGLKKALGQLNLEDRKRVENLSPDGWVPYELFFKFLKAGAAATGSEVHRFCEEFGAFQVEHDLPFIYRAAIKFGGPGLMIMEADQLWKRYHNTGHLKTFDILKNSGKARIEGHESGSPLLCSVVLGFIRHGLILAGAKDLTIEHSRCNFRGDDVCEYTAKWNN